MNVVILIGRLTKDVELRYVATTKKAVASFSIAVDRPFVGKDGQKQTDFFNIQTWGKNAENCANYLLKGSLVAVKGSVQNRSYETAAGEKKYITEIQAENVQFLSHKKTDVTKLPDGALECSQGDYIAVDGDDVPF